MPDRARKASSEQSYNKVKRKMDLRIKKNPLARDIPIALKTEQADKVYEFTLCKEDDKWAFKDSVYNVFFVCCG